MVVSGAALAGEPEGRNVFWEAGGLHLNSGFSTWSCDPIYASCFTAWANPEKERLLSTYYLCQTASTLFQPYEARSPHFTLEKNRFQEVK